MNLSILKNKCHVGNRSQSYAHFEILFAFAYLVATHQWRYAGDDEDQTSITIMSGVFLNLQKIVYMNLPP